MNKISRVCTGFSKPYVGLYKEAEGVVTYSGGRQLARGVQVSLSLDTANENNFYADNVVAESENGTFAGGQVKLTVDGLLQDAENMIYGIPEAEEVTYGQAKVKISKYGKNAEIPYVGIGYIVRYQSKGVVTWVPTILKKAKFQMHGDEAKTQEENLDYQTQDLTADLSRDDSENEDWKWVAEEQTSEAAAEAILKAILAPAAG